MMPSQVPATLEPQSWGQWGRQHCELCRVLHSAAPQSCQFSLPLSCWAQGPLTQRGPREPLTGKPATKHWQSFLAGQGTATVSQRKVLQ